MFPGTTKPVKIFYFICLTAVLFCLLIWLSAAITVCILNLAQYAGGPVGTFLIDKGPERIMRRVLLIGVIIIIVFSLKKFGWRGWKDCGWTQDKDDICHCRRQAQFGWGAALGFISLGGIALLTIFTGLHQLKPLKEHYQVIIGTIIFFCLSGISVALIEETICRGILFRVFARSWRVWPAAIIISVLFAAVHFIGPGDAAFQGSSYISIVVNVSVSTVKSIVPPPDSLIHFLNLALLGMALCVFVMRTKTIWMSVGAHAAWVFIIKLHSYFTDLNPAAVQSIWLGKRNDFMDSLAAVGLFAIIILLFTRTHGNTGKPVRKGRKIWHINSPEIEKSGDFFQADMDLFAKGHILKTYSGCLVSRQNGLVFKKYWPKSFLNRFRFAFRPPRSRRAFLLAQRLIDLGLPTPPVLAWSTDRRFGLLQSESLIVREVADGEPLTVWLAKNVQDSAMRLKVMEAYGNLMAAFHRHGYSNRDLKHENVMCSKEKPWLLWVVDLDGVRKHLFVTRRRAGRDLMRVGKSLASLGWTDAAEIAAFFDAYNRRLPPRLHFISFPE